ncbi:hypothetical protein [Clostridium tyrobutyricum]|uniref:hypothetical protein n=1 Tax=Clostridium tyrobutyricum TaxID=1519 RepID=UPI001C38CFA0|nr:hypothetical protein [Clostridium tyrobutyricum]MBV4427205.1 hypothetical protein [Clostridium tyrobutyricum]MBV4442460.1 hypothetical protein [Clostridium tyrobutyricum]
MSNIGCTGLIIYYFIIFTRKCINSILKICMWMFLFPFLLSVFFTMLFIQYYKNNNYDHLLIIVLCICIILLWIISALILDRDKVKAAILINNAIIATVVSVTFLTSLNPNIAKIMYDKEFIEQSIKAGIPARSIAELGIKLLTLPYILAGIWSKVIIDIRCMEIINIKDKLIQYMAKIKRLFIN